MFVSRGKRMRKEKKINCLFIYFFSTVVRDAHDLVIAAKSSSLSFQSCRT